MFWFHLKINGLDSIVPLTSFTCQPSRSLREWTPSAYHLSSPKLIGLCEHGRVKFHKEIELHFTSLALLPIAHNLMCPQALLYSSRPFTWCCPFKALFISVELCLFLSCFFTKVSFKLPGHTRPPPSRVYQGSAFPYLFCSWELLNGSSGTSPAGPLGKQHSACRRGRVADSDQTFLWRQSSPSLSSCSGAKNHSPAAIFIAEVLVLQSWFLAVFWLCLCIMQLHLTAKSNPAGWQLYHKFIAC